MSIPHGIQTEGQREIGLKGRANCMASTSRGSERVSYCAVTSPYSSVTRIGLGKGRTSDSLWKSAASSVSAGHRHVGATIPNGIRAESIRIPNASRAGALHSTPRYVTPRRLGLPWSVASWIKFQIQVAYCDASDWAWSR